MRAYPGSLTGRAAAAPVSAGDLTRSLLAFGVLPNALFWALGTQLYMMRPLINVDYLGLGCLAPWLPRPLLFAALAFDVVLDAVVNAGPAFHLDLHELLSSIGYVVHVELGWVLAGSAALVAAGVVVARVILAVSGRPGLRSSASMAAITFLICAADVANGTSIVPISVTRAALSFNVANSVVVKIGLTLIAAKRHQGPGTWTPLGEGDAAAGPLLKAARDPGSALPQRIGLINVESWGLFRQQEIADQLSSVLRTPAIAQRYTVESGEIPFHGVTIDGELRELCGVRLDWMGQTVPECLPKLLEARGYETVSMHGFTSQFYDRTRWYPEVGFGRRLFAQDLRQLGLTRTCGSGFEGQCDPDVARAMAAELERGPADARRFVYWMTLNSHLPLSAADGDDSPFDCSGFRSLRGDPGLCLHTRVLSRALASVAQIALDPALPPTELIVVGDHAPPSLSLEHRGMYDQTHVPFIRLIPRSTPARATDL